MDKRAVEATRQHYNRHAAPERAQGEALAGRRGGRAYPLKQFHNHVKRLLLRRFARGALLDLCCGRGGDLQKWWDAGVRYVLGIDLAELEVEEARRRYAREREKRSRRGQPVMEAEFFPYAHLGEREMEWDRAFDVVSCQFAIHYFFVQERAVRTFLRNASAALRPGGIFLATFPDGKRVLAALQGRPSYQSQMLSVRQRWEGPPQCFASPYQVSIADTVTEGEGGGSYEYLVFFNVLQALAKEFGLEALTDYGADPELAACFEPADRDKPFKHFYPPFKGGAGDARDRSLSQASELFCSVVFRKVAKPVGAGEGAGAGEAPPGSAAQEQRGAQQPGAGGAGAPAPPPGERAVRDAAPVKRAREREEEGARCAGPGAAPAEGGGAASLPAGSVPKKPRGATGSPGEGPGEGAPPGGSPRPDAAGGGAAPPPPPGAGGP